MLNYEKWRENRVLKLREKILGTEGKAPVDNRKN
jgi:hypothetical protein